jgi:hypothetical protein
VPSWPRRSLPSPIFSAASFDGIAVERAVIGLFFTGVKLSTGHAGACATPIKTIPSPRRWCWRAARR